MTNQKVKIQKKFEKCKNILSIIENAISNANSNRVITEECEKNFERECILADNSKIQKPTSDIEINLNNDKFKVI